MYDTIRIALDPEKLALAMAAKGYNTSKLAEVVGKSRMTVTTWLKARTLNPKQAGAIAKALEVDVKELV